jgi:geranylgeranyl diphosphate synthase type I
MAVAIDKADAVQEKELKSGLGNPVLNASQVEKMQEIITQTGALAHIELMIEELTNTSLSALNFDEIHPIGRDLLTQLAVIATSRKI